MTSEFKGKKVAVLGGGIEGISSAEFLKKHGAEVTILDEKESKDYLEGLSGYEIIVRSPGVKRDLPEILEAEKNGVVVTSQINIFFDLCPCPIIGVTGTKGKGTTASLIHEMCQKQGLDAYLGGNIGKPPLDFLDKLDPHSASSGQAQQIVVLELSSFQLLDLKKSPSFAKASAGKPHVAVMLMATSEHLDYHKDVYEYIDAKRNLLRLQNENDFAVINKDYPASRESDMETKGKVFFVSREEEVGEGCFIRDNKVMLSLKNQRSKIKDQKSGEEIISIDQILLPGEHNLENVCAAVMAAKLAGVSNKNITEVLKTFKGLEHRLELIGEINGVKYYDDSFSTTPETAIAAIKAFKNPEILILGGSSKGSDFTQLGQVIFDAKNIKAIIGIGVEWAKIKSTIRYTLNAILYIEGLKDMRSIVQKASEISEFGDVVLLSPACASFDMFKNYKDRGEQFKKEVNSLK